MKNIVDKISAQIGQGRLGHAYLVFGAFEEEALAAILEVGSPDLFKIIENPIKISHIRELSRWIQLKPHSSPRKLAVVYQAENMTLESANALLKVLEEPPPNSLLVLQAFKKERILPTILSRCQILKGFSKSEKSELLDYLSPEEISKLPIKDRFGYANKIFQSEELPEILNRYEEFFRREMLSGRSRIKLLSQISRSRDLLLTNSSVKLLLENLLLNF